MNTKARGFTLIELLIGSALMLFVIIAALSVYSKSNQISVDQQQYTEIQHDVRSAMYLVMRDARMAGNGLPEQFNMYAIEGVDNEDQGDGGQVRPDRLILMGNMDDPLLLQVDTYGGAASTALTVANGSFEQYPYLLTDYIDRLILILPNPAAACRLGEVQKVSGWTHPSGGVGEALTLDTDTLPTINLPSSRRTNLSERLLGTCTDKSNYHGGTAMFVEVKEYWLDITGTKYGADVNGYIGGGVGGVLYQTKNGIHNPIAQNIENFQVEYNGDINLPADGQLDGFEPWDSSWTLAQVSSIRQVRVLILGRTANAFVGVSGRPADNIHHYRRPDLSNSPGATTDDLRRRFLLESTSNIRNLSLNLYNRGVR
jgi:hypothetical protein